MEKIYEAKASVKNTGVTHRKTRLVVDMIRGKSVTDARAILKNVNKAASPVVLKLLNSAASNAVNNNGLDETKLYVKTVYADEGMKLKKFRPRAKGRSASVVKRTSHINIVLEQR